LDAGLSGVDWTDAGIRRPKRASRIGNGKPTSQSASDAVFLTLPA
jgi:hypothetical protein